MNKTKFIERIAEEADGTKSEAQRYFEAVENVITSALKDDERVQRTGFGKFYAREQKAREGVNPQTGERIKGPARKVPAVQRRRCLQRIGLEEPLSPRPDASGGTGLYFCLPPPMRTPIRNRLSVTAVSPYGRLIVAASSPHELLWSAKIVMMR